MNKPVYIAILFIFSSLNLYLCAKVIPREYLEQNCGFRFVGNANPMFSLPVDLVKNSYLKPYIHHSFTKKPEKLEKNALLAIRNEEVMACVILIAGKRIAGNLKNPIAIFFLSDEKEEYLISLYRKPDTNEKLIFMREVSGDQTVTVMSNTHVFTLGKFNPNTL